jgi:hypothetical protein
MGEREIKENDGGGDTYKNIFCKCYYIPPPSTTIKNNRKRNLLMFTQLIWKKIIN